MNGSAATTGSTWDEASSPEAVRLTRQYEDSWRRSGRARPDLVDYLSGIADLGNKTGVRLALFRTDMALRWEAGEKVGARWYLDRFPDLSEEALVALIYEEFCLREENGERPDPRDFQERFPQVSKSLERVFEVHGLVGSGGMSISSLSMSGEDAASEIPFPEVGQTIAGFHLVEDLGKGAFARVFLAHERQLADRPVALKVTRKGSREPQTLARLQHTHIVPVYSHRVDPATGLNLLCMPYFGRITLAQILSDSKSAASHYGRDLAEALDRLAPSECPDPTRAEGRRALASRNFARAIAWWGARLAEALHHAHERGVLHRDIKPSNVLVTADGMPMLLDFNLAREPLVDGKEEASSGNLGGTIDYMAPEHLEALADGCPRHVDGRSDLFGLGVVLYEAVMGHRPFQQIRKRSSMSEALLSAADERRGGPPRLRATHPEIPPALETVIRRCLEPAPDDRYQTGAELAADLQAVADDRPLQFAREPLPSRIASWARQRRKKLVTAGAVATTIMVIFTALGTVAVERRLEYREKLRQTQGLMDKAEEADKAGNFSQAKLLYASAAQLSDVRDWKGSIALQHGGQSPRGNKDRKESPQGREDRSASQPGDVSGGKGSIALQHGQESALGERDPGEPLQRSRHRELRSLLKEILLGGDSGHDLAELQNTAHVKEINAAARAIKCKQADEFHRAADGLRFRLIGLGGSLKSASEDLQVELGKFFVLESTGATDWTKRTDVKDQLDEVRLARMRHEVNELMFLWVSAIDITLSRSKKPDPESAGKALNYCDVALRFVDRPAPWKALRSRLERRWNLGQDASIGAKMPNLGEELDASAPRDVRDESSALAAFQWGVLYVNELKYAAAIRWLQRAVQLEAKNDWYQFYLAFVHDRRGNTRDAMVHYDLAADLSSNSPWIHFSRARLYRSTGNWKRAVEDLNSALEEFRDRPEVRQVQLELGFVYQSLGDDRRAHRYFRAVIAGSSMDPLGRAARLNLANGQAELGKVDAALKEYGELLTLDPTDQAARHSRALMLLRVGKPVGAESDLNFLVDLGERCLAQDKVLSTRALARLMQGGLKAEGAVEDATSAWNVTPSPAYERLRQRAFLATGRLGEIRIDRPEEISHFPLGGERIRADLRAAVAGLSQQKRKGRVHPYPASLTQSVILAALGEPQAAESAADVALHISPDSPHALLIRARGRLFNGDLERAMADVERGLMMDPAEPGLLEMKAAILIRIGRPAEALDELKFINSEGVDHPAIDTLRARAYMALAEFPQAISSWDRAIRRDPQLAEAYLGRARCRISREQLSEAVVDLSNAASWADGDLKIEGRVFLNLTRCLPNQPSLARRWYSFGLRVLAHAWEQLDSRTRVSSR